jgi:hypothetical protein
LIDALLNSINVLLTNEINWGGVPSRLPAFSVPFPLEHGTDRP